MNNIILAIDFSESTQRILDYAIDAAAPNADFVGYEAGPQNERDFVAAHYHKEHRELGRFSDEARQQGINATALLVQGPTVEKLIHERERLQADLMVAGSHGRSAMFQLVVGSTCEGLIRKAGCPVMIVPCNESGR